MFKPRSEYQEEKYWDERSTVLLNQNLSFSDKLNEYFISRKTAIAIQIIEKHKPKTILDAGCGSGAVLIPLSKKYTNIQFYAIDFSQENLKQIPISKNIITHKTDVWNLPFNNREIDLLFSFDVLYHLTNEQKMNTLNEYYRVSKQQFYHFRGEEITVLFHYDFMFKKLRLPSLFRDRLTLFFTKRIEKNLSEGAK